MCTENDLIEIILGLKKDPQRRSTLQLALNSARFYCGYNPNTEYTKASFILRQGIIEKDIPDSLIDKNIDEGDLFTSLFLYLNCLEQIGNLFSNSKTKYGIDYALSGYSELKEKERTAIRCLRNSLAHSFGLVNYNNLIHLRFKYTLSYEDSKSSIVQLPSTMWNDFSDKSEQSYTIIYIIPFIRMSESIMKKVVNDFYDGYLKLGCNIEEAKARYTFVIESDVSSGHSD